MLRWVGKRRFVGPLVLAERHLPLKPFDHPRRCPYRGSPRDRQRPPCAATARIRPNSGKRSKSANDRQSQHDPRRATRCRRSDTGYCRGARSDNARLFRPPSRRPLHRSMSSGPNDPLTRGLDPQEGSKSSQPGGSVRRSLCSRRWPEPRRVTPSGRTIGHPQPPNGAVDRANWSSRGARCPAWSV